MAGEEKKAGASESFGTISLKVSGKDVYADLGSELTIADLSTDMDEIAAKLASWGVAWGEAEGESERVDAAYRFWRAQMGKTIREMDPKAAEWKVDLEIDGSDDFRKFKEGIALATRNKIVLKAVYESFRVKASILQSKGAMLRAELEATGMSTRRSEDAEQGKSREATVRAAIAR